VLTAVIRLLVIAACAMLAWGAWQQVVVGMGSRSGHGLPGGLAAAASLFVCGGHRGDGNH